jgi:hypothetical protein
MKMSTNMWIYWDDAVMGSCGDEDWDNPKGRNGYNAQATGDCTNVYQKGRPGSYWGKKETSNEVDKPLDKGSTANGRGGLDK